MIVLVGLVALAGCQSVDGQGSGPTTTAAANQIDAAPTATSDTGYPSLHSVPPRPQLTYSLQQRRAIVDGLIGDRENARYTDQVVRYRTGRSSLPPPPAPPVVAAIEPEATPEPDATPPDAAAPPPESEAFDSGRVYRSDPDDSTLHGFVDEMVRGTADEPPAAAGSDAEDAAPAGAGWFGWLRGLFGQADPPAPQPQPDPPRSDQPTVMTPAAAPPAAPAAPADAEAALSTLMVEARTAVQPAMAVARAGGGDDAPAATTARTALADRPGPGTGAVRERAAGGFLRTAAAGEIGQPPAAPGQGAPLRPETGDVGIAIGDGEVAIEVAAPTAVEPGAGPKPAAAPPSAARLAATQPAVATPSAAQPSPAQPSAAHSSTGRRAAARPSDTGALAGWVTFMPGSAALPVGVGPQLERVLAAARAQSARIRIVGEAEAGALALDRARAVAVALVRLGARPHELEMTLARDATGDQARLLLAAGATR